MFEFTYNNGGDIVQATIGAGSWFHITVTSNFQGRSTMLYVNRELIQRETSIPGSINDSASVSPFMIGNDESGNYFHG